MNILAATFVWTFLIGGLILKFRQEIADVFQRIPLPIPLLFVGSGFLFAMIEENINCPPEGCSPLPSTWVLFLIFLLIHLAVLKIFRIKSFKWGIISFGFIGWVVEFVLGASKGLLWSAPWIAMVMTIWVIVTYAIIVIVPVTIRNRQLGMGR